MNLPSKAAFRLSLNTPAVACQIIEGEAILIHFDRGNYFSVGGSGAFVLELLNRGLSADEIGPILVERFDVDRDIAMDAVTRFWEQLLAEDLVVTRDDAEPSSDERVPEAHGNGRRLPFEEPRLAKYTDLQDLLVLDPIHDVIVTGWPVSPS